MCERKKGGKGMGERRKWKKGGIKNMGDGDQEGWRGTLKMGAGVVFPVPVCSLSLFAPLSRRPTNLWPCCEEAMEPGASGWG